MKALGSHLLCKLVIFHKTTERHTGKAYRTEVYILCIGLEPQGDEGQPNVRENESLPFSNHDILAIKANLT